MTVYIVIPFRPDAIMEDELSTENKAVDCPDLTKIVCTQGPGAHFCARVQGRDLCTHSGTVPEFRPLSTVLVKVAYYATNIARLFKIMLKSMLVFANYAHFNKIMQKLCVYILF